MGTDIRKFKDAAKEYSSVCRDWISIFGDADCVMVTYNQGDLITDAQNQTFRGINRFELQLGIILEGRAEICEEYMACGSVAYRPIRILEKGQLFGEFSILDRLHGSSGNSRPGETFKIWSGFRSALITKKLRGSELEVVQKLENGHKTSNDICAHVLLDNIVNTKTIIACLDGKSVKKGLSSYNKLLDYAWPRAKIYRDCINSFNYIQQLNFKHKAMKHVETLESSRIERKPKYDTSGISKTAILPLFIETLFDAFNRPIRKEPMFAVDHDLPIDDKYLEDGDERYCSLIRSDILSAIDPDKHEHFYYPVDLSNYILASHANKEMKDKAGKGAKTYETLMKEIFGGERSKKGNKLNSRAFYKDLSNLLLKELTEVSENCHFSVECKDIGGIVKDHLVLHFSRQK